MLALVDNVYVYSKQDTDADICGPGDSHGGCRRFARRFRRSRIKERVFDITAIVHDINVDFSGRPKIAY